MPLAVLVAGFFGAAFLTGPFLTGAFLLAAFFFFAAAVAVAFLVTPAALVRGPGAAFVFAGAGGAVGVLDWIRRRGRESRLVD